MIEIATVKTVATNHLPQLSQDLSDNVESASVILALDNIAWDARGYVRWRKFGVARYNDAANTMGWIGGARPSNSARDQV